MAFQLRPALFYLRIYLIPFNLFYIELCEFAHKSTKKTNRLT